MHSSQKYPVVGFSLKGRKCGNWLSVDWEGAGAKDASNRAENWGCLQGFWLDMSFAEDAAFVLKSLDFLQAGQAGEMRGKVAKIEFFRI